MIIYSSASSTSDQSTHIAITNKCLGHFHLQALSQCFTEWTKVQKPMKLYKKVNIIKYTKNIKYHTDTEFIRHTCGWVAE